MDNTTVNGVLAIIEDRPEDAKSILGNQLDRSSRAAVSARVYGALDKRDLGTMIGTMRALLMESLKVENEPDDSAEQDEAFFRGVKAVEDLIEKRLKEVQDRRS